MYSYFRFLFRYIQTYSTIIQEHTHPYSEPCVSRPNSEPRHIPITKHVQTPRYIQNTILNIFIQQLYLRHLIQFWMRFFYRCYLTSRVTNFTVSLTLYFIHIRAYSRLMAFLETFCFRHILNATHNIYADSSMFRFPAYLGTLCFRHIRPYLQCSTYWGYIFADSGIFQILPRHIENPWLIQTYLKQYIYLVNFRHFIQVLCTFWTLFRQIQAFLELLLN